MTTRPRSRERHRSWIRAWVPTTTDAWPDAIASRARVLDVGLERAGQQRRPRCRGPRAARRRSRGADGRAGRSGPAAPPGARPAPRRRARRPRPRSCPIRRRPGAGAASASGGPGRRGSRSMAVAWSSVSSTVPPDPAGERLGRGRCGSRRPPASSRAMARGRGAGTLPAPRDHAELERQQLVERQPAQGGVAALERVRVVGLLERRGDAGRAPRSRRRRRRAGTPGRRARRGRAPRGSRSAGGPRSGRPSAGRPARSGRRGAARRPRRRRLELRVVEGQLAAEPLDLAATRRPRRRREPALDEPAPEPGRLDRAGVVLEPGDRPLDPAAGTWARRGRPRRGPGPRRPSRPRPRRGRRACCISRRSS